jgi:hypothetical protein
MRKDIAMHHINYHGIDVPPGFDMVEAPFIQHRYSRFAITHDPERIGGWAVVHQIVWVEEDYDFAFSVVSFCDRLEQAVGLINCLTNPAYTYEG